MQYEGHVAGGVIVLDDNAKLAEGTRVQIVPIATQEPLTLADKFQNVIGQASGLPDDMAAQHDHYIHGSPEAMTPVFADTFFFLALINPRDNAHAKAVAVATSRGGPLVTTAWVLTEIADGLAGTPNRHLFNAILADLKPEPSATIVPMTQELFERGVQLYLARLDKKWSLTDCISFVVMEEQNITESLTADRHFEQAGFVALLK